MSADDLHSHPPPRLTQPIFFFIKTKVFGIFVGTLWSKDAVYAIYYMIGIWSCIFPVHVSVCSNHESVGPTLDVVKVCNSCTLKITTTY